MRIEVTKDIEKKLEYEYEAKRIISKDHKKLLKNPNKKILSWKYNRMMEVVSILFLILLTVILFFIKDGFYTLFYAFYLIMTVYIYLINHAFIKNVEKFYQTNPKRTIVISKDGVTVELEGIKLTIMKDILSFILISPYAISFITTEDNPPVSLPVEYKEEVLEAIKKEKLDIKVIDNSKKYK